jgi:DNA-binding transcriptional MerR regulator
MTDLYSQYLDAAALAKILQVTPATVRAWAKKGLIPALRSGHKGSLRFERHAVAAALSRPARLLPRRLQENTTLVRVTAQRPPV